MDNFSIEDVGEQFRADIGAALAAMRLRLQSLLTARCPSVDEAERLRADLDHLEDGCHTVVGSSSLVAANGLVAGVANLRRVIDTWRIALDAYVAATTQMRRVGEAASRGLDDLDRLLDLELQRKRGEADAMAKSGSERIDRLAEVEKKSPVPAVAPTSAPAAEEESFDFLADEGDQAQPIATSDSTAPSHPGEFDFGILMEDDPVAIESEVAAPAAAAAAAATMSPTLAPVLKS
ncbi:MAG TPA: hypothetical protein VHX44_01095, partial [Planctomycetota bacterium]|nr:hypothetical protein [Planctomycetota bacterium]